MTAITPDATLSKTLPDLTKPLQLSERNIYSLILLYRWLSFIPPLIAVILNFHTATFLALSSFGLALVWLLWRTYGWLERRPQALPWLVVDLVLVAMLVGANGIWSSPYYLYALGPIFEIAFFYGLKLALGASLTLSASYGLTLMLSLIITGQGGNWLVSVTNVTGFILSGALFGYQSEISRQLRNQAGLLENYHQRLEKHTSELEQAHTDLERIYQFNQTVATGSNSEKIYELAVSQILKIERVSKATIARLSRTSQDDRYTWIASNW